MKKRTSILGYALIIGLSVLSYSCKKDSDGIGIPVLTTSDVTEITPTTGVSGGNITDDGGALVTGRGVCWSKNQTPTISDSKTADGSGAGSFISHITGLTLNTSYYVRAYATNSKGTRYGSTIAFTTEDGVADADGNIYNIVTIGTQTWMAENLKTTKYNDGMAIPLEATLSASQRLTAPGYCWYNNDSVTYKATYGGLYNWSAVATGKLAPTGWHVPTYADWNILINYSGGDAIAGGNLKETGTKHWKSPNTGATNETGFTAVPGGGVYDAQEQSYSGIGVSAMWWFSGGGLLGVGYKDGNIRHIGVSSNSPNTSHSVRCVKD